MIKTGDCIFSPDRAYRYVLRRDLGDPMVNKERPIGSFLLVIGLNPSTADETQNDPTITRCIGFAQSWGFRTLCMMNAFAFRATDPKEMKAQADPVGPDNNYHLKEALRTCASCAGLALAAWGAHGDWKGRDLEIEAIAGILGVQLFCFGRTRNRHPRHPLYLNKTLQPIPYP